MLTAHHDFETGSACDLRKAGVHRYAEHPSTRVWMMSWRIGEHGPISRWHPGDPDPVPLLQHVAAGGIMAAHNAAFERTIWNRMVRRIYAPHWPELRIEQQDCTMARCAVLAIPQSLEIAGKVLGAKAEKDMAGNAVMQKMMRPRKVEADGTCVWWDSPDLLARNGDYCDQDVVTETEIDTLAPHLTDAEREVWRLDQRINDRGVQLDVPTIERAIAVREIAKARLDAEMAVITQGVVRKCTQSAALIAWIASFGIACTSVAKSEQEAVLTAADEMEDDILVGDVPLPEAVRRALDVRKERNKTSTAKLTAMMNCACADGRARGLLAYHGTNTGRWAGRLIQPQNLYRTDPEKDGDDIDRTVAILTQHVPDDAHDMLAMMFGSPMTMLAKAMRNMIVARPDATLKGADLSNIEGRLAAWLAGEEWKLQAFRLYDAKMGPDLYRVAYARSFGIETAAVTGPQRQIGKVEELALGYEGGVGSFVSMGKVYGLRPEGLVAPVQTAAPEDYSFWMDRYAGARDKRDLPRDQWAAIKVVVSGWRAAHPKIKQGWRDLMDAAVEAVANPGQVVFVFDGKARYLSQRGFLWCQLPSGRVIAYPRPRLTTVHEEWIELPNGQRVYADDFSPEAWRQEVAALEAEGGTLKNRTKKQVIYEGYEGTTRKWTTFALYGGMQFNHIVQGSARDVMVGGMLRAEAAGYDIVLTVHDEVLSESAPWHGSGEELEAIMAFGEPWLVGCPLAAKGWEGLRYAK